MGKEANSNTTSSTKKKRLFRKDNVPSISSPFARNGDERIEQDDGMSVSFSKCSWDQIKENLSEPVPLLGLTQLSQSLLNDDAFLNQLDLTKQEQIFTSVYVNLIRDKILMPPSSITASSDSSSSADKSDLLNLALYALKVFLIQTDFLENHINLASDFMEMSRAILQKLWGFWNPQFQSALDPSSAGTLTWFQSLEYCITISSVVLEHFPNLEIDSQFSQLAMSLVSNLVRNETVFPDSIVYEASILLNVISPLSNHASQLKSSLLEFLFSSFVASFHDKSRDDSIGLIHKGALSIEALIPLNILSALYLNYDGKGGNDDEKDLIMSRTIHYFSSLLECFEVSIVKGTDGVVDHSELFELAIKQFNDFFVPEEEEDNDCEMNGCDAMDMGGKSNNAALAAFKDTSLVSRLVTLLKHNHKFLPQSVIETLIRDLLLFLEQEMADDADDALIIQSLKETVDFSFLLTEAQEREGCLEIAWSYCRLVQEPLGDIETCGEIILKLCDLAKSNSFSFYLRSAYIALTCFICRPLVNAGDDKRLLPVYLKLAEAVKFAFMEALGSVVSNETISLPIEACSVLFDIFGQDHMVICQAYFESGLHQLLKGSKIDWANRLHGMEKERWLECEENLVSFIHYKEQ